MVPKAFKEVKQQVDIVGKGRVDHGGSSWKGFAVFSRKKPAATDYVKCFMHTPQLIKISCHKTPYRCPHRLNLSSQSSRSYAGPNTKVLKDKDLEFANSIGTPL